MKKLMLLFGLCFVIVVISISLLPASNGTYKEIEKGSFEKITDKYSISYKNDILNIKSIKPGKKEGIVVFSAWPFLPDFQFKRYQKQFISGTSFDIH